MDRKNCERCDSPNSNSFQISILFLEIQQILLKTILMYLFGWKDSGDSILADHLPQSSAPLGTDDRTESVHSHARGVTIRFVGHLSAQHRSFSSESNWIIANNPGATSRWNHWIFRHSI
jgi:hypothetical protein